MRTSNRLLVILVVFSCFTAVGQTRKIALSANKQPLTRILEQIEQVCGYSIVYSNEVLPDTMLVTMDVPRITVAELLDKLLPEKQLFYKMMSDRLIVIGSNRMLSGSGDLVEKKLSLSGQVIDPQHMALPFASVGLMLGTTYIAGNISNENGVFQLLYAFKNEQKYTLKASSVGYQSKSIDFNYPKDTALLKNIVLTEEQNTLNTVSITTSRPLIERKSDRYIVNVEGTALANGNTGLDVLRKSPGIWVDTEGVIKIKGNQSVMVMINDVVQRMSEEDLAEYLRTLRSEDIKKIEVISNPPSEFEAAGSGGIIHIVLKKSRNDGLVGQIRDAYWYGNRPFNSIGGAADYKVKNLYVSGNASYVIDKSNYVATTDIVYPDKHTYAAKTDRYNNNTRNQVRFGLAYDLSANQLIGLQVSNSGSEMLQTFKSRILLNKPGEEVSGNALSDWVRRPENTGATLNYLLRLDSVGSMLKVIGDYVRSSKTELNDFTSRYSDPLRDSRYRNNTPNMTNIYTVQADYTKVFANKLELKTGLKYVAAKRDNTILSEDFIADDWVKDPDASNQFIYNENLLMAYASLEQRIHRTSIKLGLRAEETNMKGNSVTSGQTFSRRYLGWFPSVFLVQKLNDKTEDAIYLNYSRRLKRPQFNYLNPYRLHFDDYVVMTGNPDLLPEYTHKVELGYNFGSGFSADVYYSLTENTIAQLVNPIENNVIEHQPRNFNNSTEYGLSLEAPVKPFKWWTINNSVVLFHFSSAINDFKINKYSVSAKSMQVLTSKKLGEFDMLVNYGSPYIKANSTMGYVFYIEMGITKKILNDRLRIRLAVNDILNTFKEQELTEYKNTRISAYQKRPTRSAGLSLSYSFRAGKQFKNKKIEQSNEEEKNRIGN